MDLTPKQEKFVQNIFSGMIQREAWIKAGYSSSYPVPYIDSHACALFNSGKIQARYKELRDLAASGKVMLFTERQERLSEIARARLTDYVTDEGIKIDKDSPNTAALQGIKTKVKYSKKGREPEIVTDIDLHDPAKAIDLLNKMDKIYSDIPPSFQDNRTINIIVSSEKAKQLVEGVSEYLIPVEVNAIK